MSDAKPKNPLEEQIKALIHAGSPLTVAQYMAMALGDAQCGYYNRKDPFGVDGDFTTAPEISQMFGEMVGAWLATSWRQMGSPRGVALVELGPGRGTLMKDILRSTKNVEGFHNAISVHLVEMSPVLTAKQKEVLADENVPVSWHQTIETLPKSPLLVVANEFFDALPVHQMVKVAEGWREKMIVLDENQELAFLLSPLPTIANGLLPADIADAEEGAVIEICPAGEAIMEEISAQIVEYGGALLAIDYGYVEPAYQETLQSVKEHKYHDPLRDVGEADITAHVDFSALRMAAEKADAVVYDNITQGEFLLAMGIAIRAEILQQKASDEHKKAILSELQRLVGADEMGTLFKCMCVTPPNAAAPYGF